jgi:hypothetical protein
LYGGRAVSLRVERQDRQDDAEPEQVDEDGEENDGNRVAPHRRAPVGQYLTRPGAGASAGWIERGRRDRVPCGRVDILAVDIDPVMEM